MPALPAAVKQHLVPVSDARRQLADEQLLLQLHVHWIWQRSSHTCLF